MTYTYSAMAVPLGPVGLDWVPPLNGYACCEAHCRRQGRPHSHILPCLSIDDTGRPCPGASERKRAAA